MQHPMVDITLRQIMKMKWKCKSPSKQHSIFNTTLRFKCNVGFTLPDMYDSYRLCQENETWSGLEPTCSGKYIGHAMGLRGVFCQQRATTTCAITLRKHAHTNILKISPPKTESFQIKILMCFIFLLET